MRLWHYKILQYLPKSQLLAQWRELNSIFKKQDNHILINYVYECPKENLLLYSRMVIREMIKREYKIKSWENYNNYFKDISNGVVVDKNPFPNHHTDRYLKQCFYNLQEKYDRGQKDFDRKNYEKLLTFICEEEN
jgi:uncharacterized protein (TIGR02328 family)